MVLNKLVSFQIEYAPQFHLTKYISSHSRLQLIHINNKASPLVEGYFVVGTECPTDSGVPHTLEHLVFMGSHKHPYKGFLDMAGNLCMSSTNAWTATDQTVYSLTTAGWTGFKKLLPIYLDHVLNPVLSEHAFTTEVYHLDPDDLQDKGVVFSEMQALEFESTFLTTLEKQRQLFPQGSGYRSETGGLTANLRELTNDAVKQFHEDMYSAENLCVIIVGNVPESELLQIMESFDSELPVFSGNYKRPFIDTKESQIPESRTETTVSLIEFPEADESQGEMLFSWIGEPYISHMTDLGVSLLMDYFTETSLAPFKKELVEVNDPLANAVYFDTDDFMRTIINVNFYGVPTERLHEAKDKVLDILQNHKIDLSRMRQIVKNAKWDYVQSCERSGSTMLSTVCITDFLYGPNDGKVLEVSLKDLSDFEELLEWSQRQWQELLNHVFVENKPVIVLGKPSSDLYDHLEEEQAQRLKKRENEMGTDARLVLKDKLEKAIEANSKRVPSELLEEFIVSNPEKSVNFIETKGITTLKYPLNDGNDELTRKVLNARPDNFPFFIHLEHYSSEFVWTSVSLNTASIKDVSLLPLYHILCEIFSFPMKTEDGILLSYEEVVSLLKSETLESHIGLGILGECGNFIGMGIYSRYSNYRESVKWIKHCLYDMVFDQERVRIFVEKNLSSAVELKRSGVDMLHSIFNRHMFTSRAMKKSTDPLFVKDTLTQILDDIDNGLFETKVLPKLEILREQLRSNFNMFHILISGDVEKMGDIYEPWVECFGKHFNEQKDVSDVPPIPRLKSSLSDLGKNPKNVAHIITTPASDSCYMRALSGLPNDLGYQHPDYPAIVLAAEYLGCVEGPLWKGIRGSGLAYDASIEKRIEYSVLEFSFYRAADPIGCFQKTQQIVNEYSNGSAEFSTKLIPAALSSIIHHMALAESNYSALAAKKYIDIFCKNRGSDFNRQFLQKLGTVTAEDLQKAVKDYFVGIFKPQTGAVFVSCHPTKLDSIRAFLEQEGYEVSVEELEEDSEDESCAESGDESSNESD